MTGTMMSLTCCGGGMRPCFPRMRCVAGLRHHHLFSLTALLLTVKSYLIRSMRFLIWLANTMSALMRRGVQVRQVETKEDR
jgi:hypothetical protein